jgi:tetratricopeptide (TPR) repeat protein
MRLPKVASVALVLACAGALGGVGACGGESDRSRGDRLASQRRWREAVDAYEQAIDRYPHDYDAAWGIARIYCFEVHLHQKCLAWTTKLLEAYPTRADYRRAAAQGWTDKASAARAAGDEPAARAAELEAKKYE